MKAKLLLLIFVLAASSWCLIVITFATQRGVNYQPLYLSCPWAGIVLGTTGGFLIGALGLRVYAGANHKAFMKKLAGVRPIQTVSGNDPLVPCQVGHRQPYIAKY